MKSNNINLKDFNLKVKPTDDFYEFVNGNWIKNNPIPHDQAKWGTFNVMAETNRGRTKKIFNELVKNPNVKGESKKIKDFYLSGMDMKKRNKSGYKELEPIFCDIDSIRDLTSFFTTLGHLHQVGIARLWSSSVNQDIKNVDKYIFEIFQGGLSLPDRGYYLKPDKHSKHIRKEYMSYMTSLFELSGSTKNEAEKYSKIVMKIETTLAKHHMNKVQLRDPNLTYNKFKISELKKKYPRIQWDNYFKSIGIKNPAQLIVGQPKFFSALNSLIPQISLSDWRIYLKYKVLSRSATSLSEDFYKVSFNFYSTVMYGIKKQKPLWKIVMANVEGSLGEAIGKEYVKRHFSPHAKKHVIKMTAILKQVFRERVLALDWMSPETKKKALAKLGNFKEKIGYPDKWADYSKLKITRDSYFANISEAHRFEFKRNMDRLKKKKVDRQEWFIAPQIVNAFCDQAMNELVFPAGILDKPFFDHRAPDSLNYGAIGSVIGHELTHGFDDKGSLFDVRGNLKDWWTKSDKKKFESKTKVLEKQFGNFEPIKGMKINGQLTLGENMADLGGLIIAYHGYIRSLKNKKDLFKKVGRFTNAELFFMGYALTERAHSTESYLKQQLINDPHSPSKYRVNGILPNMEEFYEIFGCKVGDKLYLPEDKRARIW